MAASGLASRALSTAGLMGSTRLAMLGGSLVSSSTAPTAPHWVCPSTTTRGSGADVHGVFDGADLIRGRDVAGHPDHKDIADALVEDDFRRHPGVGAGEDRGQGVLALRRGQGAAAPVLAGMLGFAVHVTGIAFLEEPQGFIGGDPRAPQWSPGPEPPGLRPL